MAVAETLLHHVSMAKSFTDGKALPSPFVFGVMALVFAASIFGDVEGLFISVLFGIRLVVILRLRRAYYMPAAILEAILVSVNPSSRIFPFDDGNAHQAHLSGIAATYLSAWFLSGDRLAPLPPRKPRFIGYVLFISAVTAATILAIVAYEHYSKPSDFFFLVSSAYAKLAVHALSAVIFGFFAAYVIDHPGLSRRSIAVSLLLPPVLYLLYLAAAAAFGILNNPSFIYLMLLLLIGGLAVTAYRFGVFSAWTGCISAVLVFSGQHNGWSLSTWHAVISYLIFLNTFILYIAFFINRLNQAKVHLDESKKREELLIRNMQEIVHSQNALNSERLDRVVRDLHDEVGQSLVAASIYIRSLEHSLDSEGARRAFEKGSAALEATSISIRNMLSSLSREPVNYAYLSQELMSGRIAQILRGSGVSYRFAITPESPGWGEVPPEIYAFMHRFFQESVTNILRHSHADQCRIALRMRLTDEHIRIIGCVRDNDLIRNFDFNKKGSTGLDGLVQKTRQAGGILRHGRKATFKKIGFLLQVPRR